MPMFLMADPQTTGIRAPDDDALPETGLQILGAQFAAFEIFVHQVIVGFGDIFDQDVPVFLNCFGHIRRNIDCFCRLFLIVVHEGLHGGQIDHPGEGVLGADGKEAERDLLSQTAPGCFRRPFQNPPVPDPSG